ncbi:hypothetical protein Tco_0693062 [Tanacetum coccineum]
MIEERSTLQSLESSESVVSQNRGKVLKSRGMKLESDKSKKQKIDEHVEAEKDDDPEEEEMKKHKEIVQDEEEIAIYAIPLATKPPMMLI